VAADDGRVQFQPGCQLGAYRVVRLLGRGGMGEVYEAEHLDTNRRVALKILNHTLPTAAERARFLREGQLAAAINHPNSVYIFATEEIDGTLAIVMELAAGGTLKDAVRSRGPMPPAAAVDAILQVIDGLEAAAASGVLHRDVKPSNCFVDGDGTVKIGDFGLSIATQPRDETHLTRTGTVLGTPAFAPPEQIRGGSLDVRSDLYSTGATLYFLLTGQPPFAGNSVVQLAANVLERDADSPQRMTPDVPDGLAQVVLRCLEKDPSQRPDSYQRLRRELLPYSSRALTPAAPSVRMMAFVLDGLVLTVPFFLLDLLGMRVFRLSPAREAADLVVGVLYFGVLEGIWSASFGKMLFGIRIAGPGHRPAGILRAAVRASIFMPAPDLARLLMATVPMFARTAGAASARDAQGVAAVLIAFAVLFSTARRGNGFAGLHDLASRTRVVRRVDSPAREPLPMPRHAVPLPGDPRHIGPYAILETSQRQETGQVLLAYDPVLRRRVWIQMMPSGSAAVPSARRDLARPGRLRWLTGKRTPVECWDAYEAPEGLPFVTMAKAMRSWPAARFWLFDLGREIEAIVAEQGDVTLDEEHVWIARSGRALLLDFRCPGLAARESTPSGTEPTCLTAAQADVFVRRFAAAVAPGNSAPLPLHAHAFLSQLEQRRFPSLKAMTAALHETLGKRAVLTRDRRAMHLALCAVVPVSALAAAIASAMIRGTFTLGGILAPLAGSLIIITNFAVWSAAWFRGGLMLRALDIAVVTGAGDEASRPRALLRAVVAWSPCLLFVFAILFNRTGLGAGFLAIMAGGAVMAYLTPERGLQDRIVGTVLVPR